MFRVKDPGIKVNCFHCGDQCYNQVEFDQKVFCCNGCKTVYEILNTGGLCEYYNLESNPGNKIKETDKERFDYLDRDDVQKKLIHFKDGDLFHIQFYIPQMHCISCLYLLENLHKLNSGVHHAQVDFSKKKLRVIFDHQEISLKQLVSLLYTISYEPYISLDDIEKKQHNTVNRTLIYKLGIAGFCFANIMLLSFPEYLGLEITQDHSIAYVFRSIILLLSLPVFFYSSSEFFYKTWIGIKNKYINIDAPVSLAISITFFRSLHDLYFNTGPGYLDSLSGIVFFMLIGRYMQSKTQDSLNFDRDYKSYFPVSVTRIHNNGKEEPVLLHEIQKNDLLKIHHLEMIPTDSLMLAEKAIIDYSFITGESEPRTISKGDLVYQGGRVLDQAIQISALKTFKKNSFIELWNQGNDERALDQSEIHRISTIFAIILLLISFCSACYWYFIDSSQILNAVTSVLIVACPCTLLLASSFTNGFMISLYAKYGLYFKKYSSIEKLSKVKNIVFDKTGTLTSDLEMEIQYIGNDLSELQKSIIRTIVNQSTHPYSKSLSKYLSNTGAVDLDWIHEIANKGIIAQYHDIKYFIGSDELVVPDKEIGITSNTAVYIREGGQFLGYFTFEQKLRSGIAESIDRLTTYNLHVLSGDQESGINAIKNKLPARICFKHKFNPMQKLNYVKVLKKQNDGLVLMIGDGLNDAGALNASDIGISVMSQHFSFSPASDAIIEGNQMVLIDKFLKFSKFGTRWIKWTFLYSLLYNIVGLSFAVSSQLNPLIAAILMPVSSISIILLSYLGVKYFEITQIKSSDNQ